MINRVIRLLDAVETHSVGFCDPIEVTLGPNDFDVLASGTDISETAMKRGEMAWSVPGCRWIVVKRRNNTHLE